MSSRKFFFIERSRLATLLRNYSFGTLINMLSALIFVELLVVLYSLKKGFLSEKIRAYSDLLRAAGILLRQKKGLQIMRKKSDKSVTESFSDELSHPYLDKFAVPVNKLLGFLSKIVRLLIR